MGRKNTQNIKKYNDKLNKIKDKEKAKKNIREEKLKLILKKFNESNS